MYEKVTRPYQARVVSGRMLSVTLMLLLGMICTISIEPIFSSIVFPVLHIIFHVVCLMILF
ncbi:hypothetical protein C2G38_1142749 [Gigaspora rosea]|uniref:Uncharacterized protein n=1 Tax=Gigaspora rosea TaxID=44941 RepID=A0A397VER3_9GLOM|nr:hypothetical protein C2G38_1142749 [Gigaspora rosea]